MIEEEDDDEAILKQSLTFKKLLKNIVVITIILLGAFFIYFGILPDQMSNFFIGFMLICFGSTLLQIQKPPPEPLRQTLSILTCTLCGLTKVRNFATGDFVYRKVDKCNKCEDTMQITKIYSVKLKKPTTEQSKKSETPKKK